MMQLYKFLVLSVSFILFLLFRIAAVLHFSSFLQTLPLAFFLLVCFFRMLYCIICFSSTTFALVSLIIGRQLVELCVILATCHWHILRSYICIYWRRNWLIDCTSRTVSLHTHVFSSARLRASLESTWTRTGQTTRWNFPNTAMGRRLCLSLSAPVCHESVFYQNGWTDPAGFWQGDFLRPIVAYSVL